MKKYLSILLMIVAAGMTGCKKDFLNKPDYGELSPEVFPSEIGQVELFVNAMYANQHSFGLYGHGIFGTSFYALEHTADEEWINFTWLNDSYQNNCRQGDLGELTFVWRDANHGVTEANTLLKILSDYRAKYAKQGEE